MNAKSLRSKGDHLTRIEYQYPPLWPLGRVGDGGMRGGSWSEVVGEDVGPGPGGWWLGRRIGMVVPARGQVMSRRVTWSELCLVSWVGGGRLY